MPVAGKLPASGLYASNVMPSKRYKPSVVPTHKKPSSVCASELTNPLSPSLAVQAEWYICAIGPASSAPNSGIDGVRNAAAHANHSTVRSSHALQLMVASSPRCPYLRTRMHSGLQVDLCVEHACMSRRCSSWCCCFPYTLACKLSRGKQPHGKQTDDQPHEARCAPQTWSRDVRCNRRFKQLQIHGERSNQSPSHIPLTGCAD